MKAHRVVPGRLVLDSVERWRAVTAVTPVGEAVVLALVPPPAWMVGGGTDLEVVRLDRGEVARLASMREGQIVIAGSCYRDTRLRRNVDSAVVNRLSDWGLTARAGRQIFASRAGVALLDALNKE